MSSPASTASLPLASAAPPRAHRATVPRPVAFAATGAALLTLFIAAGAPTPLLVDYETRWGFPSWVLTVAFSIYALALLVSLLVTGSLSDKLGRRPVLIGGLSLQVVALVVFLVAPDVGWLIAGRVIQGVATGALTGAFTASLVELAPTRMPRSGSIVGSAAPTLGLGLGALLGGLAVQLSADPGPLVFGTLAVLTVLGVVAIALAPETVTRQPGALAALRPRVVVPGPARPEFVAAIPVLAASWMFGGLNLGLIPSVLRADFGIDSGIVLGAIPAIPPLVATVVVVALGRVTPHRVAIIGAVATLAGVVLLGLGIASAVLPLLLAGSLVGGVGFGAAFSGPMRAVAPLARPHERGALFAALFVVSYLSFGIPAVIAGQLIAPLGLVDTVLGYSAVVAVAAVVGILTQTRRMAGDRA